MPVSQLLAEGPTSRGESIPCPADSLLKPGSVVWEYGGDWRLNLVLGRALLIQACHPTIGAGVGDYSIFKEDPFGRLRMSLMPIVATIYAPDGAEIGARIRAAHRDMGGTDHRGRRYHAYEPEAYWFVLATAVDSIVVMSQLYFDTPITGDERDRLVLEMREAGLRMGLRSRDMPTNWAEFTEDYNRVLTERLEDHPTAHDVIGIFAHAALPSWVPAPKLASKISDRTAGKILTLASLGTLPPSVRDLLELTWTEENERDLSRFATSVRVGFRAVPRRARYMPIARRAWTNVKLA